MKKILLLVGFTLAYSVNIFCQDHYADSLKQAIVHLDSDSEKIAAQVTLAKYYANNLGHNDSSRIILQRSLAFAKISGSVQEQAYVMYWLALLDFQVQNSDERQLAFEGLQFARQHNLYAFQSAFLCLISEQSSDKDSAKIYAGQALSIAQKYQLGPEQANAFVDCGRLWLPTDPDSARKLFSNALNVAAASNDKTIKYNVLRNIARSWSANNQPDTALSYMYKALLFTQNNKLIPEQLSVLLSLIFTRGSGFFVKDSLDINYSRILRLCEQYNMNPVYYMYVYGRTSQDIGNYPAALRASLQALRLSEQMNDSFGIAGMLESIGRLYNLTADYRQAILYLHKAEKFPTYIGFGSGSVYSRLATCFLKLHQYDSARYYAHLSYTIATKYFGDEKNISAGILDDLGGIYLELGEDGPALDYLRRAYQYFSGRYDFTNYAETATYLARYFQKNGPPDSMVFYAKRSFAVSSQHDLLEYTTETSNLIARYFYSKGITDSAYYYQSIGFEAYKKLYSLESARSFQNLSDAEQQREEDIAREKKLAAERYAGDLRMYGLIAALAVVTIIVLITYRNSRQKQKANILLQEQKQKIEHALSELKSTQAQLIQSEKMASLGELTAGIAHEIQNPLNFVNNFSEVNQELISELVDEVDKGNTEEVKAIANDIKENEQKINHHGKRADAIVKGMLQHSRSSSGVKEPTDINALADEYLRLSYHGMRAKDKSFNADYKTEFDENVGKINIIPQDIGRVLLNLYNNAFYAVAEKEKLLTKDLPGFENLAGLDDYEPTVSVSTKKSENSVYITVSDNGNGIPQKVIDKIFQPFFTTKPTGEGTGLGLSLSYDIIKAHGGELKVESIENKGTEFIIQLSI